MKTIKLNQKPKANTPTPSPEQPVPKPVAVKPVPRVRKAAPGFTTPTKPADPQPLATEPKKRHGVKGPNVLTVKKLAAKLARQFLPKKYARTTKGSDVQVAGFLFRAAGGYGTPNLLTAYRKAREAARDFVWIPVKEVIHPFGVVGVDQDDGRLVAVVDAEFLFLVLGQLSIDQRVDLWRKVDPRKAKL